MDSFDWLELNPAPEASSAPPAAGAPRNAAEYAREGRRLRRAGQFSGAAACFQQATGLMDQHFGAWMGGIDALVRAGRAPEADAKSRGVLDAYRKVRGLYASRALALIHTGALEAARPLLDVALESPKPLWYAACVEGEFFLRENPSRPRAAVSAFERALVEADDPWEAGYIAGWALRQAGHAVLAAGFFADAVHHDPRAAAGFLGLAECFERLRLHDQAAFYYECVQEIDPENAAARDGARRSGSLVYGLMRAFTRRDLKTRWKREIDRLKGKTDWIGYDL